MHWNVKESLIENKEIQDELNMLLDNMQEAILLFKEGKLTYINNTCKKVFIQKRPSISEGIEPSDDENQGLIQSMTNKKLVDMKLFMTYKSSGPNKLE